MLSCSLLALYIGSSLSFMIFHFVLGNFTSLNIIFSYNRGEKMCVYSFMAYVSLNWKYCYSKLANTLVYMFIQGGKFDHADRLFQSIESTYRNCLSNTSDVKELTPEFFYMPEFLENLNSYHLGVKQDGEPLGNVGLPPWAKVMGNFAILDEL